MWHILNYKLLMLSTILLANAYQKERAVREHRRQLASINQKRPPPHSASSESSEESKENSHYERTADLTYRHPGKAPTRRTQYSRYLENGENRARPSHERNNKGLHYDAIHNDDNFETAKHSPSKAGNSGNRRYLDNYDERQLQVPYTDGGNERTYKTTNNEAQNGQYSYNRETGRPREFDRPIPYDAKDLKHESSGTGDDRRYNNYNGAGGKNTSPFEYAHNARQHQNDQTNKVFTTSHSTSSRSHSSGSTTIPFNNNERYYDHPQPNQETFNSPNYRPKVPGYSEIHDKIPSDPDYNTPKHQEYTNTHYREPTPSGQLLNNADYQTLPLQKQPHSNPIYKHPTSSGQLLNSADYQTLPLQEQPHSNPVYKHLNQPQESPYITPDYRDTKHPKDVHSNFDHRYSSVSEKPHTDYNKPGSSSSEGSGVNSALQHSTLPEQYRIGDRGALQHLQPNLEVPHGEPTREHNSKKEVRDNNQAHLPRQQNERNPMKVVASKKDMQPAPSEADNSKFSEEHDGFLDMGAYTDKQGSFGWYADFPVGKEHDKVTYSFS